VLAGSLPAFEVKAVIKKVDADKGVVVFSAGGQDRTVTVSRDAAILDADGKDLAGGLKSARLKEGTAVTITVERTGDKPVLKAIKLGQGQGTSEPKQDLPKLDTSGLKALSDMGPGDDYHGFKGGLYPNVQNQRPTAHEKAGLERAKQVQPLDAAGKPSGDGKIVLLSIGFSNTVQSFQGFMEVAKGDREINPAVVLVNGAQGGRSAFMIQNLDDRGIGEQYWKTWVPERLKAQGVTAAQVQVVWLKQTDATLNPGQLKMLGVKDYESPLRQGFPRGAQTLQGELKTIVRTLSRFFPNVKMVYLSSRTYGGWALREGNREPFSYETGYAVKWLIEQQINGDKELTYDSANGDVKAPWLSWGPYLWANGDVKRKDGFSFQLDDFRENDRMHHSPQGQKKIGRQLLGYFRSDPTARRWFVKAER